MLPAAWAMLDASKTLPHPAELYLIYFSRCEGGLYLPLLFLAGLLSPLVLRHQRLVIPAEAGA